MIVMHVAECAGGVDKYLKTLLKHSLCIINVVQLVEYSIGIML